VLTNSGIDRLEALKGRTFAFAEEDSATGYHLPKVALLDAGLRRRDLGGWTNCRPWHAIEFVREGQFAAGAADLEDVRKLIDFGAPLRVLTKVRSPSAPWVATTNLAPELRAAIQQSLLALTDNTILAGISRGLTGFRPATAAEYDELEQQMDRARLFDQSREAAR
jgi:phosphonate transport system substrate-binding protein